ncbi:PREDICTED: uncharacterized protein C9orf85 homolog [Tauraco erythrolophus]|nr:PREDICTED: uncharacterized protein C9orf85 homolog [Tauraco erythrolophus]
MGCPGAVSCRRSRGRPRLRVKSCSPGSRETPSLWWRRSLGPRSAQHRFAVVERGRSVRGVWRVQVPGAILESRLQRERASLSRRITKRRTEIKRLLVGSGCKIVDHNKEHLGMQLTVFVSFSPPGLLINANQESERENWEVQANLQKINAKLHDGVCQHCKGILEWRVKFSKYKLLSKPKKCVKCLQKTVKDPYHIICRPCAGKLEVCAKCGKEEEIVIPICKGQDRTESVTTENGQESSGLEDDLDFDTNCSSTGSDEDSDVLKEQFKSMNFERTEI